MERRDRRILTPLRDVAQRVVRFSLGELIDEFMQPFPGRHRQRILPAERRLPPRPDSASSRAYETPRISGFASSASPPACPIDSILRSRARTERIIRTTLLLR